MMGKRVLVGLSGGVDSALTAAFLQEEGYEVFGLYCVMHDADREGLSDAKRVAEHLRIPLSVSDLREEFEKHVVRDFLNCYAEARTPNPCIVCNPAVKFKALCDEADRLGIETVATGHYAHVGFDNGRYFISQAKEKDQSYMLYRLTQEQLARIRFPLADTNKDKNRARAEALRIPVSHKPDSQDICFIRGESYVDFIERRLGAFPEGDFWLSDENRVVGRHKGLIRYTVGQRKNLGIALGAPVYVSRLDKETNRVILSRTDVVDCTDLTAVSPVFQALDPSVTEFRAYGKIRFSAKASPCTVTVSDGKITARFEAPQRAATPGQSAVFYDGEGRILCGGFLENVIQK